ncbi:sensor histidine kinase [Cohnella silvisoli]|uniref:Histidine kinase n=1 Tax=Cohnella silvisoli TaxID=2873699 RepID=A0ABV1L2E6_9BACL|nr:histidine kinase [Cohnella silvisoli]MCD9021593.1 histidine kinase [Cohnella silvisoli]
MLLRKRRASIFTKLSLTFLVFLLPFYMMTLLLSQQGGKNIRSEIMKSSMSKGSYYIQSLDREIDRILKQMYEMIADRDLMLLGISSDLKSYDLQQIVNALQKRLSLLKASSLYVEEPMIYLPLMGRTISDFSASEGSGLSAEELERLVRNANPDRVMRTKDGRIFMSLGYPRNPVAKRQPLYVIIVELSTSRMLENMQGASNMEQGNLILANPAENWSISDGKDEELSQRIKSLFPLVHSENNLSGVRSLKVGKLNYWITYASSGRFGTTWVEYVPERNVLGELRRYETGIYLLLFFSIVGSLLFSLSLYRMIHAPLRKLVSAFRFAEQGSFITLHVAEAKNEFFYLLNGFNQMTSRLKVLIQEVYEKGMMSQRSELRRLQAQINPHFLYNCFFILEGLMEDEEHRKARSFARFLQQYYRYITRDAEDHIALAEEMEHARNYLGIQIICYKENIDVEFEPLADQSCSLRVPRLIVQPIIENAYKHAFVSVKGALWIHSKIDNGYVRIFVEDDGKGLKDEEILILSDMLRVRSSERDESTGLINVHRRLQLKFGADCGLTLSRSQLGGLCVVLTMKMSEEEFACTG